MKKVVLITGASSGFGKLIAFQLLDKGYTVYCAARRTAMMDDLVKKGGVAVSLDVTDDAQVLEVIGQIIKQEEQLDVLINNAGYGGFGMIESVDMAEAHAQFEVNVFGAARLIKAVLPHMRVQKSGTIINISSMAGQLAFPMMGWYCASKHALESLSDSLRVEVESFGINVVLIEPGAVNTGFLDVGMKHLDGVQHDAVYQPKVNAFKKSFTNQYAKAPGPEKTAEAVMKAIQSKKPKTRYPVGTARLMIWASKLLPDRFLDKLISQFMGMK